MAGRFQKAKSLLSQPLISRVSTSFKENHIRSDAMQLLSRRLLKPSIVLEKSLTNIQSFRAQRVYTSLPSSFLTSPWGASGNWLRHNHLSTNWHVRPHVTIHTSLCPAQGNYHKGAIYLSKSRLSRHSREQRQSTDDGNWESVSPIFSR